MVEGGPIDVLTGDWLAELTMLLLGKAVLSGRPGYARTFLTQVEQVLPACLERGIKIVTNAGGLDPAGCAAAVTEIARRAGLSPIVAHVEGDDLLPRVPELLSAGHPLANTDTGEGAGRGRRHAADGARVPGRAADRPGARRPVPTWS